MGGVNFKAKNQKAILTLRKDRLTYLGRRKSCNKTCCNIAIGKISHKNISKVVDILPIMWYNSTDR